MGHAGRELAQGGEPAGLRQFAAEALALGLGALPLSDLGAQLGVGLTQRPRARLDAGFQLRPARRGLGEPGPCPASPIGQGEESVPGERRDQGRDDPGLQALPLDGGPDRRQCPQLPVRAGHGRLRLDSGPGRDRPASDPHHVRFARDRMDRQPLEARGAEFLSRLDPCAFGRVDGVEGVEAPVRLAGDEDDAPGIGHEGDLAGGAPSRLDRVELDLHHHHAGPGPDPAREVQARPTADCPQGELGSGPAGQSLLEIGAETVVPADEAAILPRVARRDRETVGADDVDDRRSGGGRDLGEPPIDTIQEVASGIGADRGGDLGVGGERQRQGRLLLHLREQHADLQADRRAGAAPQVRQGPALCGPAGEPRRHEDRAEPDHDGEAPTRGLALAGQRQRAQRRPACPGIRTVPAGRVRESAFGRASPTAAFEKKLILISWLKKSSCRRPSGMPVAIPVT